MDPRARISTLALRLVVFIIAASDITGLDPADDFAQAQALDSFISAWATSESTLSETGFHVPLSAAERSKQPLADDDRPFVLLIPPMAGVQLQRRLDMKQHAPHYWCSRNGGWSQLWVNPWILVPGEIDCFVDNMRRVINTTSGESRGPEGVEVRPPPGIESALSLVKGHPRRAVVFRLLASFLETYGWRKEEDLLAHLYDFRLSTIDWSQPGGSYEELKQQVEDTVTRTGRRVAAVSLSMGGTYFHYFLTRIVDDDWKKRHIHSFVSLAGAFGGSPLALLALINGVWGDESRYVSPRAMKGLTRSMPSLPFLLPHPAVFGDAPILTNSASGTTYSAHNLSALLADLGLDQAKAVYDNLPEYDPLQPPDVRVYCLISADVATALSLVATREDFSDVREGEVGWGDGVVPLSSLEACASWRARQQQPVIVEAFSQVKHATMAKDALALTAILEALMGTDDSSAEV